MAFPEKRRGRDGKDYWRGRYKRPDGKYGTVSGADGKVLKFPTKRTALKAAQDAEREVDAAVGRGGWVAPEVGRVTFRDFVLGPADTTGEGWLAEQELAESTLQTYRHSLKHLLPTFSDLPLAAIKKKHVEDWERAKRAEGCGSITAYRSMLHLILGDAIEQGLIGMNPAARRRNRGKRAGRSTSRGPEKPITGTFGALLLAERTSLLTGRDEEFVATVAMMYTGMRWGEVVGLERAFVRPQLIRVEHQLYELDSGELTRCPPKDDSYRGIDTPEWLARLITALPLKGQCPCHGRAYAFRGRGAAGGGARREGPTLADVARAAKVSAGTVSNVLNRPEIVSELTRARVEKAVAELGFVRRTGVSGDGAHWRRSGYATWVFEPAATGWYPPKAPYERRPVPVTASPWPGVPVRGRGSAGRAAACWLPIRHGLTRHGLRHAHRTLMEDLGTPKVLMDERMGHTDSSVSARYAHVTDAMRARLVEGLTEQWEASLDERLRLSRSSPVPVLERLLREREAVVEGLRENVSQLAPRRA